jgi:Ca2+-binding EF-hand superfamily protein
MAKKCCGWLICALVFGFVASSDVLAAQPKEKGKGKATAESKFRALDKNGDGKVTPDEFVGLKEGEALAKAKQSFQRLDKNKDGHLTLAEYKDGAAKKAPKKGKK